MMFEVEKEYYGKGFLVKDGGSDYLHSDGSILITAEYWPTKKEAQAVLDKYQPKHEWKHGDVLRTANGTHGIYLVTSVASEVYEVDDIHPYCVGHTDYLDGAKFLFNIKDRL